MGQLYASVGYALRQNKKYLFESNAQYCWLIKELKKDREETTSLQWQQMLSQASKQRHGYQKAYIMPTLFHEEMSFLRAANCDTTVALESHLGVMANRAHTWDIAGDSCIGQR